ncbi:MAG: hypothetical protein J6Q41_04935 [Firmicutes bacterium]|nr:hypothetical protein [Bacillota bacterium]
MLNNRKANFILAFIMAIVLWAYVLGEVDPMRTVTIRDIPIRFLNESVLGDDSLIITSMDYDTVSVTFDAKRSIANKIKESDFHATANLKGLTQGDNIVDVEITKPSNITLESVSHEHINIVTDKMVEEDKEVKVVLINESSEDTEPKILRLSEHQVKVKGAASQVNKVDKVVAKLDASRVTADPNSISAELEAVDSNDRPVEDVEVDAKNIYVTAILKYLKSVDLVVPVVGKESGSISRGYSAPDKILIKGSESDLENLDSISCETVDISDLYENKSIPLVPILPEGVEISDEAQDLAMEVAVYNAGVAEFDFDETYVNIVGIDESSTVSIHEIDITVKVKGVYAVVNSLTKEDLTLTANASDLTNGTHTVLVKVDVDKTGIDLIEVKPQKITIDVNKH